MGNDPNRPGEGQPPYAGDDKAAGDRRQVPQHGPPVLTVADARVEPAQPVDVEQAVLLAAFPEQGADVGHDGALAGAVHAGHQHGVGTGGSARHD